MQLKTLKLERALLLFLFVLSWKSEGPFVTRVIQTVVVSCCAPTNLVRLAWHNNFTVNMFWRASRLFIYVLYISCLYFSLAFPKTLFCITNICSPVDASTASGRAPVAGRRVCGLAGASGSRALVTPKTIRTRYSFSFL